MENLNRPKQYSQIRVKTKWLSGQLDLILLRHQMVFAYESAEYYNVS